MNAADVARKIGADPKRFRSFLRAQNLSAGKGNEYNFGDLSEEQIESLTTTWQSRRTTGAKVAVDVNVLIGTPESETESK